MRQLFQYFSASSIALKRQKNTFYLGTIFSSQSFTQVHSFSKLLLLITVFRKAFRWCWQPVASYGWPCLWNGLLPFTCIQLRWHPVNIMVRGQIVLFIPCLLWTTVTLSRWLTKPLIHSPSNFNFFTLWATSDYQAENKEKKPVLSFSCVEENWVQQYCLSMRR